MSKNVRFLLHNVKMIKKIQDGLFSTCLTAFDHLFHGPLAETTGIQTAAQQKSALTKTAQAFSSNLKIAPNLFLIPN